MNKLYSKWQINALLLAGFCCLLLSVTPARAGDSVPDWFRQLSHAPLGTYPEEADGVVLLDEQTLTVKENGEIYETDRVAMKILRPRGKKLAYLDVHYDRDTKIQRIRGWSIAASGQEYELKDKDAVDSSPFSDAIYDDQREKIMKVPAADVGTFVAFEWEQRERPYNFGERWDFQRRLPVKMARFTLNLPVGWEYQYRFGNWAEQKPQNVGGNSWQWEVHDVEGITEEPSMPASQSLAGMMAVSLYSTSITQAARLSTWAEVAGWANSLNASRRVSTPKLEAKVAELTTGKTDTLSKIRAIANYVQHNIRYVEISVGIGGFQSHMAGDIFANSYGDCKDKATLLMTMLHEAGVDAYFTLVNSERGVVNPAVPTPWTFNHAIVAIKLPADVDVNTLYSTVEDPKLGKLFFFDPTYDKTGFGALPPGEQNSYALVVTGSGGELIKMPLLSPPVNRLMRIAHIRLTPEGGLLGDVEEMRSGNEATTMRERLMAADRDKRVKIIEQFLGEFFDRSQLTYASIGNLDKYDEPLILKYKFQAADYAKSAGDLMLVRPRVLGNKASSIAEDKKRKYAVTYDTTFLQSDTIDIKLPAGYAVDELPPAANVSAPFAEYKSKIESKDNTLYYSRSYTLKDPLVPLDQMPALRTFMRGIANDERNTAVLKKVQP